MENQEQQKVISWITEVFADRKFEKLNVEFSNYDTSGGFAAEMVFANVTGEKNGRKESHQLIIKKGKEYAIAHNSFNLSQGYFNEIFLYSIIIPQFRIVANEMKSQPFRNIPHCYGTINKGNSMVVLLENLKPKGYRTHNLENHQDLDHIKLVLEAYAKWHAFSFALKDQKPDIFEDMKNKSKGLFVEDETIYKFVIDTARKLNEFALKSYVDKNEAKVVEKLEKLINRYEEEFNNFLNNKNENFLVLKHGDCWNNNFLFHYNDGDSKPDDVMIIDWQIGGVASPISDVVFYLFYNSSKTELENIDELLKFYYYHLSLKLKELGSDPEKCFPWNVCIKSFKRYAPLGIAGVSMNARMSQHDIHTTFDITQAVDDFSVIFDQELKNPDKYFERVDGVFQFSIDRGYI